ncbi:DNA repair protein rad18 [Hypoxylon fragiforme]|uniref:DNA repair protein rad18 n=1 Tax=Hypoxylon fragiforme TaxID=63214 RepID=UPI0020C71D9E|nr:DNA repair protein rad18 [Hypoxylon fragiforme]KAI2614211.1 DNA repair protein rad18 [Hypoxylon fragiforme]
MDQTPTLEPFEDVADSTDWLPTSIPSLANVEAALRCQVCKDFYKTPMLTSCSHTFCSLCIRRALSNDGKCPLCRTPEQEMKLRSNWSMEEVVTTFTRSRPDILLVAKRSQDTAPDTTKRKLVETEDEEPASQSLGKRLRSSTRISKSRGMEMTTEMARLEADIPYQGQADCEFDDGLVECPICWKRIPPLQINKHIDSSCLDGLPPQSPKRDSGSTNTILISSPTKASTKTLERLPAINYSMLREQLLRKKLVELGIPTGGSRQMLEKRHKEWTTIWNANCDSLQPRRKAELLQDLDIWERTVGTRAPTSSRALSAGALIKDKDFDGKAWAAKHTLSFKDLINSAQQGRALAQRSTSTNTSNSDSDSRNENTGQPQQQQQQLRDADPVPQADTQMLASLEAPEEELEPEPEPEPQESTIINNTPVMQATTEVVDLTDDAEDERRKEHNNIEVPSPGKAVML